MKITDQVYADTKRLLNNGVKIDEIANLSGASIRTIYRIRKSNDLNGYKELAGGTFAKANIKQNWFSNILRKFI